MPCLDYLRLIEIIAPKVHVLLLLQGLPLRFLLPETLLANSVAQATAGNLLGPNSHPSRDGGSNSQADQTNRDIGLPQTRTDNKFSRGKESEFSPVGNDSGTVFPEEMMAALRVVAMGIGEVEKTVALLQSVDFCTNLVAGTLFLKWKSKQELNICSRQWTWRE